MHSSSRFLTVLVILLVGLLAVSAMAQEEDYRYHIGVTIYSYNHPYSLRVLEGVNTAAEKYNAKVTAIDSEDDQAKQISDTETLITRGVDAIIATPVTTEGGQTVVDLANEAGIPIICVSRTVPSGDYAYIGSDDVESGRKAVRYFAQVLDGEGKVALVQGTMGSSSEVDRTKGWEEELKKHPGLEEVARVTGKFFRTEGNRATENIITSHPDVDAIWYQNDAMLVGGVVALEDEDINDEVVTLGVDGDPETIQYIKDGRANATLYQEAELQGGLAVGLAVAHIQGRMLKGYETEFSWVDSSNVNAIFPSEDNEIKDYPY